LHAQELNAMAVYFLNMKTFGRSGGSSAASAAAYRAGERIRDERTGKTYDHSERRDVMHKEIVLPSRFAHEDMAWARNRANLWNTAESAEMRKNARVAREYLVALPVELSPEQRLGLVRGFSQELSDRYGFAVDVAIHAPREYPGSDPRNFHAHLLTTTREVNAEGLGAKTTLDLNDANRRKLGMQPAVHELLHVRARWAEVTNEALQEAQVAARIDHRTLQAQGIDREPRPQIPRAAFEMERHGYRSVVAERLRENYQARVQARELARLEKATSRNATDDTAPRVVEPRAVQPRVEQPEVGEPVSEDSGSKSQSLEDIRKESVENWVRLRRSQGHNPGQSDGQRQNTRDIQRESAQNWLRHRDSQGQKQDHAESTPAVKTGRVRDDDLAL
jgi:ATP-dependent exoDNAse (exonuclease V) alpha subunit